MNKLFLFISVLFYFSVSTSQTVVNDTIYFTDKTIDIGRIIDCDEKFIYIIPQSKYAVSISYKKAMIDSTSNPLYPAEYFTAYKQNLTEKQHSTKKMYSGKERTYHNSIITGKIMTGVGIATCLISSVTVISRASNGSLDLSDFVFLPVILGSAGMVGLGIPIWKVNEKKLNQSRNNTTYLDLSTKGLGAQLVLHF